MKNQITKIVPPTFMIASVSSFAQEAKHPLIQDKAQVSQAMLVAININRP